MTGLRQNVTHSRFCLLLLTRSNGFGASRAMNWTSPGISRWLAGSICRVSARLASQTAFAFTLVILTISLSGCQWVSRQVANQDRRCEQLCKDAEALHEQGDFRHASSLLSEIEKSSPKNASTRDMKARLLWESGRTRLRSPNTGV